MKNVEGKFSYSLQTGLCTSEEMSKMYLSFYKMGTKYTNKPSYLFPILPFLCGMIIHQNIHLGEEE